MAILTKMGNGRQFHVRGWPRPSHSAWAENIANAWLPIQTWEYFQVPDLYFSKKIKIECPSTLFMLHWPK